MENKSISIQCDEMTKNMMGDLQEDMVDSLSRVSKTMTDEVLENITPIIRKMSELKNLFEDIREDNEDFQEKIDDLNDNISKMSEAIEVTIQSSIVSIMNEQSKMIVEHNKFLNENLHKLIEESGEIKNSINEMEASKDLILEEIKKIDNTSIEKNIHALEENMEEKLAILGVKLVKESASNKESILEKVDSISTDGIHEKIENLEKEMESNFFSNKQLMIEKMSGISDKIDEKEILIKIIHNFEKEFTEKMNDIQEEVEWGNRSFFSRIFGKRKSNKKDYDELED